MHSLVPHSPIPYASTYPSSIHPLFHLSFIFPLFLIHQVSTQHIFLIHFFVSIIHKPIINSPIYSSPISLPSTIHPSFTLLLNIYHLLDISLSMQLTSIKTHTINLNISSSICIHLSSCPSTYVSFSMLPAR